MELSELIFPQTCKQYGKFYTKRTGYILLTTMSAWLTFGTIVAIVVNITGRKMFMNFPNEAIMSTLLFTLSLAALIEMGCKKCLPRGLPFLVQMAFSTLISLYVFETLQATFWIPLEQSSEKLIAEVALWASSRCNAGMGMCTVVDAARFLADTGLLPVLMGSVFLLGTLYAIQAPYASFLWRPSKKTWCPPRPPTPHPSTHCINNGLEDDSGNSQNADQDNVDDVLPSGPESLNLITRAVSNVKASVEALLNLDVGQESVSEGEIARTEDDGRDNEE